MQTATLGQLHMACRAAVHLTVGTPARAVLRALPQAHGQALGFA
ncbi:hypothetical protein ABZV31_17965 [Streptomyces sp. NPDC005202]